MDKRQIPGAVVLAVHAELAHEDGREFDKADYIAAADMLKAAGRRSIRPQPYYRGLQALRKRYRSRKGVSAYDL